MGSGNYEDLPPLEHSARIKQSLGEWVTYLHKIRGLSAQAIYDHFGGSLPLEQINGILNQRADSDDDGEPD